MTNYICSSQIDMIKELKKIHKTLLGADSKEEKLIQNNVLQLEEILLSRNFTYAEEQQMISIFENDLPKMHSCIEDYSVAIEKFFFEDTCINKKFDPELFKLSPWYYNFIKLALEEIQLGKISEEDRVLFIGSGPFPLTAILYTLNSGCTVECIEKDIQNVLISRKLIEALGLAGRIKILHMRGEELIFNDYTLIAVPSQALPKDKILERIYEQTTKDTKTICRVRSGLGRIYYASQFEESVFGKFSIEGRAYMLNNVAISLLLKKK